MDSFLPRLVLFCLFLHVLSTTTASASNNPNETADIQNEYKTNKNKLKDLDYVGTIKINAPEPVKENMMSYGTAFAINSRSHWLTAKHVVENCKKAVISARGKGILYHKPFSLRVKKIEHHPKADVSLLYVDNTVRPEPISIVEEHIIEDNLTYGQFDFTTGFPNQQPAEVTLTLLGKAISIMRSTRENKGMGLVWGIVDYHPSYMSLKGISGGPTIDKIGRVIGINSSGSNNNIRRGRLVSTSPYSITSLLNQAGINLEERHNSQTVITHKNYRQIAQNFRRDFSIAQVNCYY